MEKHSETVQQFLAFLRECGTEYNIAAAREDELNAMTQDILHSLELDDNNYHDSAKLARTLTEVRQQRRDAKDTMTITDPIISWVAENKTVLKSLERLLGDIRKAEHSTEGRCYIPRTNVVELALQGESTKSRAKTS